MQSWSPLSAALLAGLVFLGCSSASSSTATLASSTSTSSGAGGTTSSSSSSSGGTGGSVTTSASSGSSGAGGAASCEGDTCGDFGKGCIGCAALGPCATPYNECVGAMGCYDFATCASACSDDATACTAACPSSGDAGVDPACQTACNDKETACLDKCSGANADGALKYATLVKCVVCDACPVSCAALATSCK